MATAAAERMMHLRSSSKCCSRLMEPIFRKSCSISLCSGSATKSDIFVLRDRILHALGQAVKSALNGEILIVRNLGDFLLYMFAGVDIFQFQLSNLLIN